MTLFRLGLVCGVVSTDDSSVVFGIVCQHDSLTGSDVQEARCGCWHRNERVQKEQMREIHLASNHFSLQIPTIGLLEFEPICTGGTVVSS